LLQWISFALHVLNHSKCSYHWSLIVICNPGAAILEGKFYYGFVLFENSNLKIVILQIVTIACAIQMAINQKHRAYCTWILLMAPMEILASSSKGIDFCLLLPSPQEGVLVSDKFVMH
jgi:hypothetical protein